MRINELKLKLPHRGGERGLEGSGGTSGHTETLQTCVVAMGRKRIMCVCACKKKRIAVCVCVYGRSRTSVLTYTLLLRLPNEILMGNVGSAGAGLAGGWCWNCNCCFL